VKKVTASMIAGVCVALVAILQLSCSKSLDEKAMEKYDDTVSAYQYYQDFLKKHDYGHAALSLRLAVGSLRTVQSQYAATEIGVELAKNPSLYGGPPISTCEDSIIPYLSVLSECKSGSATGLSVLANASARPEGHHLIEGYKICTWPPKVSPALDSVLHVAVDKVEREWSRGAFKADLEEYWALQSYLGNVERQADLYNEARLGAGDLVFTDVGQPYGYNNILRKSAILSRCYDRNGRHAVDLMVYLGLAVDNVIMHGGAFNFDLQELTTIVPWLSKDNSRGPNTEYDRKQDALMNLGIATTFYLRCGQADLAMKRCNRAQELLGEYGLEATRNMLDDDGGVCAKGWMYMTNLGAIQRTSLRDAYVEIGDSVRSWGQPELAAYPYSLAFDVVEGSVKELEQDNNVISRFSRRIREMYEPGFEPQSNYTWLSALAIRQLAIGEEAASDRSYILAEDAITRSRDATRYVANSAYDACKLLRLAAIDKHQGRAEAFRKRYEPNITVINMDDSPSGIRDMVYDIAILDRELARDIAHKLSWDWKYSSPISTLGLKTCREFDLASPISSKGASVPLLSDLQRTLSAVNDLLSIGDQQEALRGFEKAQQLAKEVTIDSVKEEIIEEIQEYGYVSGIETVLAYAEACARCGEVDRTAELLQYLQEIWMSAFQEEAKFEVWSAEEEYEAYMDYIASIASSIAYVEMHTQNYISTGFVAELTDSLFSQHAKRSPKHPYREFWKPGHVQ